MSTERFNCLQICCRQRNTLITYARREPNTFYAFLKRKNSRERTKRMKNVRDILIHIF